MQSKGKNYGMKSIRLQMLLALSVILSLVLAACGGGDDDAAPTAAPTAAVATAPAPTVAPTATSVPVPTGQLRVGISDLLDFAMLPGISQRRHHLDAMFDNFVGTDSAGKLQGASGFASSWEMTPDGKQWTFKIRPGIVFHDGTGASSQDFKYSLEFYLLPTPMNNPPGLKDTLETVDAPDPTTAIVRLKKTDIFFPISYMSRSANLGGNGYVVPKAYTEAGGLETANRNPIGSGPYKFKEAKVGDRVTMEALS